MEAVDCCLGCVCVLMVQWTGVCVCVYTDGSVDFCLGCVCVCVCTDGSSSPSVAAAQPNGLHPGRPEVAPKEPLQLLCAPLLPLLRYRLTLRHRCWNRLIMGDRGMSPIQRWKGNNPRYYTLAFYLIYMSILAHKVILGHHGLGLHSGHIADTFIISDLSEER